MTMSPTATLQHRKYEQADEKTRDAVDRAFRAAYSSIRADGFEASGLDDAETLVAAIFTYIEASREGA